MYLALLPVLLGSSVVAMSHTFGVDLVGDVPIFVLLVLHIWFNRAPEYIAITKLGTEYVVHRAADTWAFGIVVFAVAFADLPWDKAVDRDPDYVEFKAWGRQVGRLEPFLFLGVEVRKAVVSCLQADPADRMPMSQVIALLDETDELVLLEFQDF